eukprot:CAMPEP_0197666176 /NCGR_PEP_ID=MMETSP1338-20131121/61731_1 /TAXON_ID=43686 ORGANISM="Pelagodinium beii, Strain RCC1491" /NCGR_SAMPLE_ID=MMETSP1338 /ASSEMBLY_ACC=CAM_ASM_000754 /LENGTH=70 /DNA_ID=CAMNT_0043245159 /DNA_START=1 /DNA_END=210 /DNA_ORIENTATION=+
MVGAKKGKSPGYRSEILEREPCKREVKRGDRVRIQMSASSGAAHEDLVVSEGAAEKKFIVGQHQIPAINK